jgi:peptidoglycan/xylan/chitin deacetylase (PgdA/CDA1 family)
MNLSIIMYHYVRELRNSQFPELKARETNDFKEQIQYIKRHYDVISGDELLAAATAQAFDSLPKRALLLTFDDGYIDHFTEVFPILLREKLPACFFPAPKCVLGNYILDVNKIHYVLAAASDKEAVVEHICQMLDEYGAEYAAKRKQYYWTKLAVADRFDSKEIIFIKRILQRELPEKLRRLILDSLFEKYVTADEASFARDLYMSLDQISMMHDSGMYIGSHGYNHCWLDCVDTAEQKREIELAVQFLKQIGMRSNRWIMCYPYGAYDDSLLSILKTTDCQIGLTTKVGIANLERDDLLTLPRLDTNDLPTRADAPPNEWTLSNQLAV